MEWPIASGVHGDLGRTTDVERDDRVPHGEFDGDVAGHHGDGAHVDVRIAHRQQQRDGVVGRGVGVDDHTATIRTATFHPASLPTIRPENGADVALARHLLQISGWESAVVSRGVR